MSSHRHDTPLHDDEATPEGQAGTAPRRAGKATVAGSLRLAAGLGEAERPLLVRRLARLDAQLARHRAGQVDLELSVKDRGSRGQRLTLECGIAGRPRLVASSADPDLDTAVGRVREGIRRQLDDTATRREPRNNRQLRRPARTGAPGPEAGRLTVVRPPATPSPEAQ